MPHHDAPFGAGDPQAPAVGAPGPRAPFAHAALDSDAAPGPRAPFGHAASDAHASPDPHGSADPELAAILPGITGPTGQFRHRQHINLAYYAVRRYGMPEAIGTICAWIRQIAAYERAPQKYHHTVSRAWVEAVAYHVAEDPGSDFNDFAARNPALLDKRLLSQHYQSSTLAAPAARSGWVEPDLAPFPWSTG